MESTKTESQPTGAHTPVSNLPTEAGQTSEVGKPVSTPPAEGTNPRTVKSKEEGIEAVEGFKLRMEVTEESLPELYTAPDVSNLRDIGEASFGPPPPEAETVHGPDDRVQI